VSALWRRSFTETKLVSNSRWINE